jgi:Carboxylesterase family
MMHFLTFASLVLLAVPLTSTAPAAASSSLSQVDLGYEIHQAIEFNVRCTHEPRDRTGQTYNFSNIRFAQPLVGKLRFKAPVPPTGRDPSVQSGTQGRVCPQASPAWIEIGTEPPTASIDGNATAFNSTHVEAALAASLANATAPAPDP